MGGRSGKVKVQLRIPTSTERHWFVNVFFNCVLLGSNCLTALRLEEEYKIVVIKKSIRIKKVGTVKRRLYNIR